jgi:hypothetical protein
VPFEAIEKGRRPPGPQQRYRKKARIVIARAISNPIMERHKGIPKDVGQEHEEEERIPPPFGRALLPCLTQPDAVDEGKRRNERKSPNEEMEEVLGDELAPREMEPQERLTIAHMVTQRQRLTRLQEVIPE